VGGLETSRETDAWRCANDDGHRLLEAWLNKKVVGSLNRQGGVRPVLHELVHGRERTEKTDVTNGNHKEQRK
jgi:hypothetical protein